MADEGNSTPAVSRKQRTHDWMNHADTLEFICVQVANGGSLLDICEDKDVRYSDAIGWIYARRETKIRYEGALTARGEWMATKVLDEVRRIGTVDIREAYDDEGRLLEVKDMPKDVALCIQQIVVTDTKDGKKVTLKFANKLHALELLGKQVKLFTDRIEIYDKTLEDLVKESYEAEKADDAVKDVVLESDRKILEN